MTYPEDCKEVRSDRMLCSSLETSGVGSCGDPRACDAACCVRAVVAALLEFWPSCVDRDEAVLRDVVLDRCDSVPLELLADGCWRETGREAAREGNLVSCGVFKDSFDR